MSFSNHGRFRQQVRFLRRQFLQDGDLPFTDVLSEGTVTQALKALDVVWLDRIYSPLVTLWVFLGPSAEPGSFLSCGRRSLDCSSRLTRTTSLLGGNRRLLPSQKATAGRVLCRGSPQNWTSVG